MVGSVDAGIQLMLLVLGISSLLNIYYLLEPCTGSHFSNHLLKKFTLITTVLTILLVITATLSLLLFFAVDWVRLLTTLMVIP